MVQYLHDPVRYAEKELGVRWWPVQEEIARALLEPPYRVAVQAAHSVGKCVEADELIPLADGRMVKAGDLVGRSFVVIAWDESGKQRPAMAFAADNGVKPVHRVTTHSGRSIVRTGNHPLYCGEKHVRHGHPKVTASGWKPVDKLTRGDHVLVPLSHSAEGRRPADPNHVKLLGYLLGDGGTTNHVIFSQKDGPTKDEFCGIVMSLGCITRRADDISLQVCGAGDEPKKQRGRNPVLNLVREWGLLGKRSREKSFPDWAWELPNGQLATLLNRLFACDGWAYHNKGNNTSRVGITLASERMIRDVEAALLRLGIPGRVRYKPVKLDGKTFSSWEWVAYTAPAIRRFAEVVGIFGKEKALKDAVSVADNQSQNKTKKWRERSAVSGHRWDTVVSVEPLGDRPTVAISVPGAETFLTGFVEHNTFLAAGLVNWWHDTRDPGAVITTAPTAAHVRDVLWKEVRLQRGTRGGFAGETSPLLKTSPDHYAVGLTTSKGEAFQGRHDAAMLFIFDEAVGVEPVFYETTKSMFKPERGHAWLIIFNPTDTTSRAYQEVRSGRWRVIKMAATDHPNIAAQLRGEPPPFPSAVSLSQLAEAVEENCEPVQDGDERQADDFEFRGRLWRPGPVFQARWAGLWPSAGTYGVWSESLWQAACSLAADVPKDGKVEFGCDVARYGDDWTVIHGRVGPVSVHHEAHNGWPTDRVAGRLKELCREWGPSHNCLPKKVVVKVDDDGVGGGVIDQRGEYNFVPVNAGRLPMRPADYPNVRSELWFFTVALARRRLLSLARLPRDVRERIETQAMAPEWKLDAAGRRVVEPKDDTKAKIGRSPDDMDAVNLAFYSASGGAIKMVEAGTPPPRQTIQERARQHPARVTGHAFGRGQ